METLFNRLAVLLTIVMKGGFALSCVLALLAAGNGHVDDAIWFPLLATVFCVLPAWALRYLLVGK